MIKFHNGGLRVLPLVLCLVCLVAMALPVSAEKQAATKETDIIYTALVHNRASSGSAVIGQFENGTEVTVLEEYGDFYKVNCYDMKGYVAKEQIVKKFDSRYFIRCNLKSDETGKLEHKTEVEALALRTSILRLAEKQLGYPYVYGGMYPGGFDCSGLTYYLYGEHGKSIKRCADEQLQNGLVVARDELQIGDLVFFRETWSPWLASHVGIYAGDNKIIHASSRGICVSDLNGSYYRDYYLCARRVINTKTEERGAIATMADAANGLHIQSIGISTVSQ